jgi:hypothetical protein
MKTEQEEVKDHLYGQTKELLLPSGNIVTIREQNGDDDDILSNQVLQKDLSNQNKFIQGIVIKADTTSGKLSDSDIANMLLKDKYFIMFASRIHSIGDIVNFTYDWKEFGGIQEYDDDINKYIWDFSKEYPTKDSKDYNQYRMEPYTADASETQHMTLESGKELTFECLRIKDEQAMLKLTKVDQTINRELLQRNLKLKMSGGQFETVKNFRFFTKRDMVKIHKTVNSVDSPFMPITKIESPDENVAPVLYPVIGSNNFFFPEEI